MRCLFRLALANNPGDPLGAFKDSHSGDNLKNYAVAGISAGLVTGVIDPHFGGQTDTTNSITKGFDLGTPFCGHG